MLFDYGISSNISAYDGILIADENFELEDKDYKYIQQIIELLGDELYNEYTPDYFRNLMIDILQLIDFDEYLDDLSLCLLSADERVSRYYDLLPELPGYFDVYIHSDGNLFSPYRNVTCAYYWTTASSNNNEKSRLGWTNSN